MLVSCLQPHLHALCQAVCLDTRNAPELVDHSHMVTQRPLHDLLWSIHFPSPLTAHCTPTQPQSSLHIGSKGNSTLIYQSRFCS